jgi:hypothetical protein
LRNIDSGLIPAEEKETKEILDRELSRFEEQLNKNKECEELHEDYCE